MSNDRSPRDVCSITIGMRGLMSGWLLAAGGPQFRLGLLLFLFGCPDSLARLRLLQRNPLDLGRHAVEGLGEAQVLALGLVDAAGARLLDHFLRLLEALVKRLVDLVVADLDPE